MEVDEIQTQQQQPHCKFSRVGDNRNDSTKLGHHHHPQDVEEENGFQLVKRPDYPITLAGGGNESIDMNINGIANINRLRGWQHSSRIIRVSRASGGKDRHSKVWTSKGLRDRRVRLSVTTAIQFYDLQDRLGYDQPSKAVEWLIKAAADAIADLPSLNGSFPPDDTSPNHHHQLGNDQKRKEQLEDALDSVEADADNVEQGNSQGQSQSQNQQQQQQHGSLSKSACSSTSETSRGSGLSLSRGDAKGNRVKARERARERTAKEKEKEKESDSSRVNSVHHHQQHHQNVSPISQNSTFTELLTSGIGGNNHNAGGCGGGSPNTGSSEANLFHRVAAAARQWPLTPMDYSASGILSGTPTVGRSGFSGQIQLGNSMPQGMTMSMLVPQPATPFSVSIGGAGESNNNSNHHHHHQLEQLQHFPFGSDHLILPVSTAAGGSGADYNLNFTISSSSSLAAGFNRGTLQSNSSSSTSSPQQSLLTHLQRFSATSTSASANSSSPMDGSTNNVPFFIGTAATTALENHHNHQHHHHQQFPPGLQLLYGDGSRHSDHKGKGKS